jgi:hypothetical protein
LSVPPSSLDPALVKAWATGPLKLAAAPPEDHGWEVVFYPPSGAAVTWDATSTGGIELSLEEDAHCLVLALPAALLLPGTYVWRLNPAAEPNVIVARATGALLDGEPHPVTAVPSGDGIAGGTFEARFYIE